MWDIAKDQTEIAYKTVVLKAGTHYSIHGCLHSQQAQWASTFIKQGIF